MKTTTNNSKCLPSGRAARKALAGTRAHTPVRRQTRPSQLAERDPRLTAPESPPPYVELREAPARKPGGAGSRAISPPRVLHVDMDASAATVLASLLLPEAQVSHANTVAQARRLLQSEVFSLVVLDPALPDGDARVLLPLLNGTPLLVYSALQPEWGGTPATYLPKPWTSSRQLWIAIAGMLGIPSTITAGD